MKRHPTDLLSLVPGLLFVAIAAVALAGGLTVDLLSADWVWPSVLIALGVLVLASAGLGGRDGTASVDEDDTSRDRGPHEVGGDATEANEGTTDEVRTDDVR